MYYNYTQCTCACTLIHVNLLLEIHLLPGESGQLHLKANRVKKITEEKKEEKRDRLVFSDLSLGDKTVSQMHIVCMCTIHTVHVCMYSTVSMGHTFIEEFLLTI